MDEEYFNMKSEMNDEILKDQFEVTGHERSEEHTSELQSRI